MAVSSMKVQNKRHGTKTIRMDVEDKRLFEEHGVYLTSGDSPFVSLHRKGGKAVHASHLILKAHRLFKQGKQVMYRDGNKLNLTKRNLVQAQ